MDKTHIIKEVLNYWYITEFLCQDTFPRWDERDRKKADKIKKMNALYTGNFDLGNDRKEEMKYLPIFCKVTGNSIYETIRNLAQEYRMTRWSNITIYIGCIQREFCIERIAYLLGEADKRCEKNTEKIACISLETGQDMRYVKGSFSLSPIIWAMRQLEGVSQKQNAYKRLDKSIYDEKISQYDLELLAIDEDGKKEKSECIDEAEETICFFENEYVQEYAYSLNYNEILKLEESVLGNYLPIEILNSEFEEEEKCTILEKGIWIKFTLYKDEKTQNDFEENEYQGLSRNYFATDLAMVLAKAENLSEGSKMHKKLADYITSKYEEYYGIKVGDRNDLLHINEDEEGKYKQLFFNLLNPANAPKGKWPSRYMPSFMQQVAIDLINLDNEPIFSVNGPPGTGKTTFLKELIVHNIVERANLLSQYDEPDKAFEHYRFSHGTKKENAYTKFAPKYHGFKDDRINNYGIIVASFNNNAVENISKELPIECNVTKEMQREKEDSVQMCDGLRIVENLFTVDQNKEAEWLKEVEENRQKKIKEKREKEGEEYIPPNLNYHDIYFTRYARNLFGEKAWGLIAAPLGKKKNINDFYWKVLYNLDYALCTESKREKRIEEYQKVCLSFKEQLDKVEKMQQELKNYSDLEERKLWNELSEKLMVLENEKNSLSDILKKYKIREGEIKDKYDSKQREIICAKEEWEKAVENEEQLEDKLDELREKYSEYENAIEVSSQMNFLVKLFNRKKVKETSRKISKYRQELVYLSKKIEHYEKLYVQYEAEKIEKQCNYNQICNEANMISKMLEQHKKQKVLTETQYRCKKEEIKLCSQEMECWCTEYKKYQQAKLQTEDIKKIQPLDDKYIKDLMSQNIDISTEAHVATPWFSQEYNREREKLFYEALRLHEAFILASTSCRDNITNLEMYWRKRKGDDEQWVVFHREDIEKSVEKLYQTLFLLVPVISTTFASVGSFF